MAKWDVVYERAIRRDGSLFFPERLSKEFLEEARQTMGSYIYANQYQNEIIPEDEQTFKPSWIKYYSEVPKKVTTFAFIDPALSETASSDYTALVVVQCDVNKHWYVRVANRYKINPTEIVNLIFRVNQEWKPNAIGVEEVAFQKALLYMVNQEMLRRNVVLPVTGIKPDPDKSKHTRILGLVPRFEWSRIFLNKGLYDLELELGQFPRGSHDDLIDSLAYIDQIAHYPVEERKANERPAPNHPDYEKWFIQNAHKQRNKQNGF